MKNDPEIDWAISLGVFARESGPLRNAGVSIPLVLEMARTGIVPPGFPSLMPGPNTVTLNLAALKAEADMCQHVECEIAFADLTTRRLRVSIKFLKGILCLYHVHVLVDRNWIRSVSGG